MIYEMKSVSKAGFVSAAVLLGGVCSCAAGEWTAGGGSDTFWANAENWGGTLPPENDSVYWNHAHTTTLGGDTPSLGRFGLKNGTFNLVGGSINAVGRTDSWVGADKGQAAVLNQSAGTATFQQLNIGCNEGSKGSYNLSGGIFNLDRGKDGFSLYLGANHHGNPGGQGFFKVTAGMVELADGVKLGQENGGTGVFEVQGSACTITVGDKYGGAWEQHAGSVLRVGVDEGGLTPIVLSRGSEVPSASFEPGAKLHVDFKEKAEPGTWVVMRVEGGEIVDRGLEFAEDVDVRVWSFKIDNSGADGVLTVTAAENTEPLGLITASVRKPVTADGRG